MDSSGGSIISRSDVFSDEYQSEEMVESGLRQRNGKVQFESEKSSEIEKLKKKSTFMFVTIIVLSILLAISIIIVVVFVTLALKSKFDSTNRIFESYDIIVLDSRQDVIAMIQYDDTVYIDVRTKWEFFLGSAKGAINIPYDQITENNPDLPEDKNTPIVVFCRSGRRSGMAKTYLEELGYTNVVNGGTVGEVKQMIKDVENSRKIEEEEGENKEEHD